MEPEQRKWSREKVVAAIQERFGKGEKLNSDYIQKHNSALYNGACCCFGSWRLAIEAAGLTYDQVRILKPKRKVVWSKEIVIGKINELRAQNQQLNSHEIQKNYKLLYAAAVNYFAGWKQAIEAAGLDYDLLRKKKLRVWSREEICCEIQQRHSRGESIRGADVAGRNDGLYQAAMRHFGERGWEKARVAAGFSKRDPKPSHVWTKEAVLKKVQELNDSRADLSVSAMIYGPYKSMYGAARKIFGSWAKALRAVGIRYSRVWRQKMNWWTRRRVLSRIRKLETLGVRLSSKEINLTHGDLFGAAIKHFGSWAQAVEAAGISYQKHCKVWSTKAWLRKLKDEEYRAKVTSNISRKRR